MMPVGDPAASPAGVECAACGHTNRPDRPFCTGCGSRLAAASACAACGTPSEPGERFCGGCGAPLGPPTAAPRAPATYTPRHLAERILTTRSALAGERKQVTVLFADVKGSMDLAERVDPEAWHQIMDRFFMILAEGVHRFEGTVNQYAGDGIMALFGAPIAHEDHPHRACWAALHLSEALRRYADELRLSRGLSFSVRMGINSGVVVVGRIGDDLRMEYTAQGHTVGLAQRMEQIAEPGRVYLTGHTARLVAGYFRLRELGPLTIKGASEPIDVHELEGAGALRSRLDVSRARGFSRFVGRGDEMATLEAALARSLEGHPQVVGVVADAGVGKSRLCLEFVERCRARGLPVNEAHCVAHGKMIPFLPILELLRGYFGIAEQDGDQVAREKIAGRLLLLDTELTEAMPLVFDFLGVSDPAQPPPRMDPEARQRQLFAAIRRLVQAQSRRDPGVLLLEDMHWADGGSEAFFANHMEAIPGTRGLVLVNFRPEYHASWMQKSYYLQLPLLPLSPEATSELLRSLLGADPSLDGLAGLIGARAAGNPFFVEEIVQALVASGALTGAKGAYRLAGPVEDVAIPETVQGILAARIDRLAEREKGVLQTAAVIGREFGETVLGRVAELPPEELGPALRALEGAELVYEQTLFPEIEYAFKHPLTQEVAYRSQLTERRARVHAAVARAVAEVHADKLDERAALLAHHWEAAGELLEAARWTRRAAEWVGSSDPAEALRHWRRLRGLVERVPESVESMTLGLQARVAMLSIGWRLGIAEEEAATLFAEGRALGERSGNVALAAHLRAVYAAVRGTAGSASEFLALGLEAVSFAERSDPQLRADLMLTTSYAHYLVGRLSDALAVTEDYLASVGDDRRVGVIVVAPFVFAVWFRSMVLFEMGRLAEAMQGLERAERLSRERGETEILGWVHMGYATRAALVASPESALVHARASLAIALRIGSAFSRASAYRGLGHAHLLEGAWDESIGAAEQALAVARECRTGLEGEASIFTLLAEAHLGRGDVARARAAAEAAIAAARQRGTVVLEPYAQLVLARVLLRSAGAGAKRAIDAALDRTLALAHEMGARIHEPQVHLLRAELASLSGDEQARARELGEASRLFGEMGATARAEQVLAELESPLRRPLAR